MDVDDGVRRIADCTRPVKRVKVTQLAQACGL